MKIVSQDIATGFPFTGAPFNPYWWAPANVFNADSNLTLAPELISAIVTKDGSTHVSFPYTGIDANETNTRGFMPTGIGAFCVPTTTEVLPPNVKDMTAFFNPGFGGPDGTSIVAPYLLVPPQPDFIPLNADWQSPGGGFPTLDTVNKTYVFTFDLINITPPVSGNAVQLNSITIQSNNNYYDATIVPNADGTFSFTIMPGNWTAGDSPKWGIHSLSPVQDCILIVLADFGFTYNGFYIGNLSITYTECV